LTKTQGSNIDRLQPFQFACSTSPCRSPLHPTLEIGLRFASSLFLEEGVTGADIPLGVNTEGVIV